ncbi:single-stranded DNA-binding protein [Metamycoplasma neophronis]|uniref:Single-stranded DNA-binding protein n=1 Tax=Metamycoplasma neophronis TaxID=872983 RepID=A0ABY2Z5P1_9BACT|nr:single-stranded DNA-binding protein [Metamycoplasma neophronis]TPR54344.1 single-stranded DNA-binding protein [Metamycoplasma neophronis]
MNKVILVGRLASAPYKGVTASNIEYSRFTVAVRRQYTNPNGETVTDFIPCVAWRNNGMFVNKYLDKGSLVSVEGTFQSSRVNGSDGQVVTAYVVSVDRVESLETREVTESRKKNNLNEFAIPNQAFDNLGPVSNDNGNSSNDEFVDLSWDQD